MLEIHTVDAQALTEEAFVVDKNDWVPIKCNLQKKVLEHYASIRLKLSAAAVEHVHSVKQDWILAIFVRSLHWDHLNGGPLNK